MIKIVDRYVGKATLIGIFGVWVSLTMLMAMFLFLDELGSSDSSAGLLDVVYYVALRTVDASNVVFPVSALLGAMIGVGSLAAGNELVSFRTAGVSRLRISGSVLGAVLILTLGVMVVAEWVMPTAEVQARNLKEARLSVSSAGSGGRGMWIRDGNDFISIDRTVVYAGALDEEVTLLNVVQYSFDDDRQLRTVERASEARHDGNEWMLENTTGLTIDADGVTRKTRQGVAWDVSFEPGLLATAIIRPRYMSMRAINEQNVYLRQNGLDTRAYNSELWRKALFPVTVLALVLAGMPFLFGSSRTHGMGLRIFIGMSLGGIFMIVSKAMQNFSDAYALPAYLGAGLPSVLLAVAVIVILRRSV